MPHLGRRCHAKRRCIPWFVARRAVLARLALRFLLANPSLRPPIHDGPPPPPFNPPGDVLIFVHADTRPPPSLLPEVLAVLRRPQVVLGGFRPVIGESRWLKAGLAACIACCVGRLALEPHRDLHCWHQLCPLCLSSSKQHTPCGAPLLLASPLVPLTLAPSRAVFPCPAEHEGKPLRFFSTNNTLKTYYGPLLLRPVSFLRHAVVGLSSACELPARRGAGRKHEAARASNASQAPCDHVAHAELLGRLPGFSDLLPCIPFPLPAGACAACLATRRSSAAPQTSGMCPGGGASCALADRHCLPGHPIRPSCFALGVSSRVL